MIKIISKKFKSWSNKVQEELLMNTISYGEMKPCVIREPDTTTFVYFDNDKICGWLAKGFAKSKNCPEKVMILFVNNAFRNKGIGEKLIASALKNEKEQITVLPWDPKSTSFFNKMQKIFPKLCVYNAETFFYECGYLNTIWSAKKHV